MAGAEPADRYVVRFETTAKASADAHALARGLARVDLLVDIAALVLGAYLIASDYVLVGAAFIVLAALSLAGTRSHFMQRGVIALRYRSLLGRTTEVTIDGEGLRLENPLASSFMPWQSVTKIRSNRQTVVFLHESVMVAYIPSSAFASPAAQAMVVAYARDRVGSGRPIDGSVPAGSPRA